MNKSNVCSKKLVVTLFYTIILSIEIGILIYSINFSIKLEKVNNKIENTYLQEYKYLDKSYEEKISINLFKRILYGDIKIHNRYDMTFFEWYKSKYEISDEEFLKNWSDLDDVNFYIFNLENDGIYQIGFGSDINGLWIFKYDIEKDVLIDESVNGSHREYIKNGLIYYEYKDSNRLYKELKYSNTESESLFSIYIDKYEDDFMMNDIQISEEQFYLFSDLIDIARLNTTTKVYTYNMLVNKINEYEGESLNETNK